MKRRDVIRGMLAAIAAAPVVSKAGIKDAIMGETLYFDGPELTPTAIKPMDGFRLYINGIELKDVVELEAPTMESREISITELSSTAMDYMPSYVDDYGGLRVIAYPKHVGQYQQIQKLLQSPNPVPIVVSTDAFRYRFNAAITEYDIEFNPDFPMTLKLGLRITGSVTVS